MTSKGASSDDFDPIDSKSIDDDGQLVSLDDREKSGKYSSQTSDTESASEERRDEVQEIRNRSRYEDRQVQLWRSTLLFIIFVIGGAVAGLTFYVLREEEKKAMTIAVRTVQHE